MWNLIQQREQLDATCKLLIWSTSHSKSAFVLFIWKFERKCNGWSIERKPILNENQDIEQHITEWTLHLGST